MRTPQQIKFLFLAATMAFTFNAQANSSKAVSFKDLKKKITKEKYQNEDFNSLAIFESRYASWGVKPSNTKSSINLAKAWKKFEQKKEIVVAVVDTGIDPNHPFLKDNIYVPNGASSSTNYGIDFSKGRKYATRPFDTHGHGTHVSGIVKSVFPKVKILPLKYYNRTASGKDNLDSTIQALKYAVDQGVDIINYSGGGPEPDLEELEILKKAERKGILIVAAAGNEESNIDNKKNAYFPASYKLSNIITVTAHDQNLQVLSSSNYGKVSVDIAAPGSRIKSAVPRSRANFLTGTSQATAFVSGVAAMLKAQFPNLKPHDLKKIITLSAKKEFTLIGKCRSEGRLDATRAQSLATQMFRQNNDKRTFAKAKKQQKRNIANSKESGKIIYRLKK
ncbi:S8 family peptidase [Bacteriovorax sp. DB6_IX]|uniref:S8 family peptidase n=1 Tax=Bacteriovorax sp. DB6_IX TaxID=1353530 RepID=UPI00038A3FF7|nr:S8 family peptidase [Bacteriovorax sp. DB6_IX]EQC51907.1 peptidase, S8/S53 family [Bacteriovorax sp. DB6_IX]